MFPLAMNRSVTDVITVTNAEEKKAAEEIGYMHGTEFWTRYNAGETFVTPEIVSLPSTVEVTVEVPKVVKRKRG